MSDLVEQLRDHSIIDDQTIGALRERAASEIERLRKALAPLAAISLWRDYYPDGPDILSDTAAARVVSVKDIQRARTALR